jgi:hypothetical protein
MRNALLTAAFALLVAVSGCNTGPRTVQLKGKLTNNGKSVLPERRGGLTIVFAPEPAAGGQTFPTHLNLADDTYEVPNIPLGKYKVNMSMMPPTTTADGKDLSPATAQSLQQQADQFNSKYSATNTPIVVDVTGPNLDIDLSKYK